MKKFTAALIGLCLLSLSGWAQNNRTTRPRIVPNPVPSQTDSTSQTQAKRPPVLIGDTRKSAPTTTTTTTLPAAKTGDAAAIEEDDEIIKVETNLVTFPVSVLDRDGRFISGLRKEDFQIFENGVQQQIDTFASVEKPFTVVLLIDISPSTQFRIDEIQDAAIAFVDQLRRDDRVMVISFDEHVHVLSQPTNNRNLLRRAILSAQFGDGTSLYDAVDYVVSQELRRIEGRKAVVLFTDGVNTTSRRATYQSTVRETEEADALFYPIRYDTMEEMNGGANYPPQQQQKSGGILDKIAGVIFGGGNVNIGGGGNTGSASRSEYETGRRYLEELARTSGGRMFEANRDLTAAFSGIAEELRRQYSLGYYPETVGQKGERRTIRVRVRRPNVVVRAKNSYIVGESGK